MSDFKDVKVFDATRLIAAAATPSEDAVTVVFDTKDDGKIAAAIPAAMVGPLIVVIKDGYRPLSRSAKIDQDVLLPMQLTASRPFESGGKSDPVLLLRLDGIFELALLVNDQSLDDLEAAIRRLRGSRNASRPKMQ